MELNTGNTFITEHGDLYINTIQMPDGSRKDVIIDSGMTKRIKLTEESIASMLEQQINQLKEEISMLKSDVAGWNKWEKYILVVNNNLKEKLEKIGECVNNKKLTINDKIHVNEFKQILGNKK